MHFQAAVTVLQCGQFQNAALKSERGRRSAEAYNATLLIGMNVASSFCTVFRSSWSNANIP